VHTTTFAAAAIVLATALLLSGCTRGSGVVISEERPVASFTQVEVAGIGEIILSQGETESLLIEAEDNIMPTLLSEVSEGVLRLTIERGASISPTKPIRYRVVVKDMSAVRLSGATSLTAGPLASSGPLLVHISGSGSAALEELAAEALEVSISGSGNVEAGRVDVGSVTVTVSGSGNLSIAGRTAQQSVSISGSGDYDAADLESETATAKISGTGSLTVWVTGELNASISGSGNISYYGAPSVDFSGGGSGSIRGLGDK
jgi:hypothetical protein